MVHKWKVKIPELTGNEERNAYIYLPDQYDTCQEKYYPVLYMFDGHNVFFDEDATYGKSWGMYKFMNRNHVQMIICAVECSHDPNFGRLKEYAPFTFRNAEVGLIDGRGKKTMDWYVNELKPAVDAHFRTMPDREHTFIAGSSMGGLMSLYALMDYNHIFSRAAALSPSLWTDPRKVKTMINKANLNPNTVLYMDYGSEEMKNHRGMSRIFGDITSLLMQKGVCVESRIVPGGEHSEASWEKQLGFFMRTLFYKA
jgi:predicted alpha/beta superfamily hydrolase